MKYCVIQFQINMQLGTQSALSSTGSHIDWGGRPGSFKMNVKVGGGGEETKNWDSSAVVFVCPANWKWLLCVNFQGWVPFESQACVDEGSKLSPLLTSPFWCRRHLRAPRG